MIPITLIAQDFDGVNRTFRELSRRAVDGTTENERVLKHRLANTADSTAIANTLGDYFDVTYTLPYSLFLPGRTLHLVANGVYSTTGTPTLTFSVMSGLAGTTTVLPFTAKTALNNASNASWFIDSWFICRTGGVSGTVMPSGRLGITTATGTDTVESVVRTSASSVDLHGNTLWRIRLVWSAADAANTATLKSFIAILSDY